MTGGDAGPRVRAAGVDDLDAIVEIYLSSAGHHATLAPERYRVPDPDAVRSRFRGQLEEAEPEDVHLVATVDGVVVGAADAIRRPDGSRGSMRIPGRTAEVGIAVLLEWRGRGIGTALLLAVEGWARAQDLDGLVLDVAAENEDAERLYRRLGYGAVSLTMARSLAPEPAAR